MGKSGGQEMRRLSDKLSTALFALAALGLVDFVVQMITCGRVKIIRSFLVIIFGEPG